MTIPTPSNRLVKQLAGNLKKVVERAQASMNLSERDLQARRRQVVSERTRYVSFPFENVHLFEEDIVILDRLAADIGEIFPGLISEDFARSKIEGIFLGLLQKHGQELWQASQHEIQSLVSFLYDLPAQHEVIVPIRGLILKVDQLTLGNISIWPHSQDDRLSTIVEKVPLGIISTDDLKGISAYALTSVTAKDSAQIAAKGQFTVETALNVIRLFRSYYSYGRWAGTIGTMGSPRTTEKYFVLYCPINPGRTAEAAEWKPYVDAGPSYGPVTIDQAALEWMRTLQLERLADLCLRDPRDNDIHRRIGEAMRWAGEAKASTKNEDRFLKQWIALEVLLGTQERRSAGQKVADVAAYLLAKSDVDSRKNFRRSVLELWKARIGVVHFGKSITLDQAARLDNLVRDAVLELVKRHSEGLTNLSEWLDKQRYTTRFDIPQRSPEMSSPTSSAVG